jgi:hypothetical protein
MFIPKYHKIQSIFKRDNNGKFTHEFSRPEFEYLYDNQWAGYEKVDGTNIRIGFGFRNTNHYEMDIRGRTDKAQIQPQLYKHIIGISSQWNIKDVFSNLEDGDFAVLFGEGYGNKIQKAGKHYLSDSVDFILFDVMVNGLFLKKEDVYNIGKKLGLDTAPILFRGTLGQAIEETKKGLASKLTDSINAEGLVLFPEIDLCDRRERRIVTKVKEKDFR